MPHGFSTVEPGVMLRILTWVMMPPVSFLWYLGGVRRCNAPSIGGRVSSPFKLLCLFTWGLTIRMSAAMWAGLLMAGLALPSSCARMEICLLALLVSCGTGLVPQARSVKSRAMLLMPWL